MLQQLLASMHQGYKTALMQFFYSFCIHQLEFFYTKEISLVNNLATLRQNLCSNGRWMLDSILSFTIFQNELHPSYSPRRPKEVSVLKLLLLGVIIIHASNAIDVMQFTAVYHFDAQTVLSLTNESSFESAPKSSALPLQSLILSFFPCSACTSLIYLSRGIGHFPPRSPGFLSQEMAYRLKNVDAHGYWVGPCFQAFSVDRAKKYFFRRDDST